MRSPLIGLLIAVVAGAGGAAGPPAATAASDGPRGAVVATPRFLPAAGPVLAGDGTIVWVSRRDDAVLDLWVAGLDGAARRIQRFVGSDTTWLRTPRLAASAAAVGLAFTETRAGTARVLGTRSYLGAVGQPLDQVSSCAGAAPLPRSFDVAPTAAVFRDGPACTRVTVRGLGPAAGTTRRLPGDAAVMRLAGAYEAWLDRTGAVVVRETATGREVTGVPAADLPRRITDLALRADGTLALLYRGRVALLDPGATRPRTLPLELLSAEGARWVDDGLAVVAAQGASTRLGLLQVVDSTGSPSAPVLALGHDRDLLARTELSDRRAVWVARGCSHAVIRTVAVPAPAIVERTPACALRLRRPARVRAGRLRLGVSCAGFVTGCSARVVVRAGTRLVARGTAHPNHSTPPYAAADLRLTNAGRALLVRRPRLRVQISARIGASKRTTSQTLRR